MLLHNNPRLLITDPLPEQTAYHDTGCEASYSCLRCPLPQCKYDDPVWYQRYKRHHRDSLILAAHKNEGASILNLAQRFQSSSRTIHRALRRARSLAAISA